MINKTVIILIVSMSIFEMIYQYMLQKAALSKNYKVLLIISLIILLIYGLLYFRILKSDMKLGITHILSHSFGIVLIFFIGYFFFNQKINFNQLIGVILIILGISIIGYYEKGHSHEQGFHNH